MTAQWLSKLCHDWYVGEHTDDYFFSEIGQRSAADWLEKIAQDRRLTDKDIRKKLADGRVGCKVVVSKLIEVDLYVGHGACPPLWLAHALERRYQEVLTEAQLLSGGADLGVGPLQFSATLDANLLTAKFWAAIVTLPT